MRSCSSVDEKSAIQAAPHHTNEEYVAFLVEVVISQSNQCENHIILDNLGAHKL
jgi:hypothetical protein